jgi:hypothetical protein
VALNPRIWEVECSARWAQGKNSGPIGQRAFCEGCMQARRNGVVSLFSGKGVYTFFFPKMS